MVRNLSHLGSDRHGPPCTDSVLTLNTSMRTMDISRGVYKISIITHVNLLEDDEVSDIADLPRWILKMLWISRNTAFNPRHY